MQHIMCHIKHVTFQVSRVVGHISSFLDKLKKLVLRGPLSTGPTPSFFILLTLFCLSETACVADEKTFECVRYCANPDDLFVETLPLSHLVPLLVTLWLFQTLA